VWTNFLCSMDAPPPKFFPAFQREGTQIFLTNLRFCHDGFMVLTAVTIRSMNFLVILPSRSPLTFRRNIFSPQSGRCVLIIVSCMVLSEVSVIDPMGLHGQLQR
jgi:hypothetical protein